MSGKLAYLRPCYWVLVSDAGEKKPVYRTGTPTTDISPESLSLSESGNGDVVVRSPQGLKAGTVYLRVVVRTLQRGRSTRETMWERSQTCWYAIPEQADRTKR